MRGIRFKAVVTAGATDNGQRSRRRLPADCLVPGTSVRLIRIPRERRKMQRPTN